MVLALVIPGCVVALIAALCSLFAGYSIWAALGIYVATGNVIALTMIALFALRCARLDRAAASGTPAPSHG